MSEPMWTPDEELLHETVEAFDQMASTATDGEKPEHDRDPGALGALERLGTLVFLDRRAEAKGLIQAAGEPFRRAVVDAMARLDGSELDEAAGELLRAVTDLAAAEPQDRPDIEDRLVEALRVRDEAELVIEGARQVLGEPLELPLALEAALMSYDELVAEESWTLLGLGSRRAARSAWAAPRFRRRLWWWHRGADLPSEASEGLGMVARLIQLFPAAREELERLLRAEATLKELTRPTPTARVISPGARRAGPELAELTKRYALAAATSRDDVVYEHEAFTLTLLDDVLVLNLARDADLTPGAHPSIELVGLGDWSCIEDEEIPGQYVFPLGGENPRSLPVKLFPVELRVPLTTGEVTIPLVFVRDDDR